MRKRRFIITFLIAITLGIGVYTLFYENDPIVRADQTEEKQNDPEIKESKQEKEQKGQDKEDDISEAELYQEKFNIMLNSDYEEIELTKDEAKNWVNVIHNYIDINLGLYAQGGFNDSDPQFLQVKEGLIAGFIGEFIALDENYDFENDFHNDMAKELYHYFEEYAQGDTDALFGLKNLIFELDLEVNPDLYKQMRANYISLTDAERIRNGQEPLGNIWE